MLAPDLFNIYVDSVARQLEPLLQRSGVTLQFRIDGDLKTVRRPTHSELMWILLYADDIALIAEDMASLKSSVQLIDKVFSDFFFFWVGELFITYASVKTHM